MQNNQVVKLFERFVPATAAPYCARLYEHFGFEFKIKKARKTKLGDFRYDPRIKKHTITINNDLNPYAFLITYIHEVAHLVTFEEFGNKVNPHGKEWKKSFKQVAKPILSEDVFPAPILLSLKNYLKNPKAASCSDPILFQVLKQFDEENGMILLKQLKSGDRFTFHDKEYLYLEKKRTRILCELIGTKRKYLINQLAEVHLIP